MTGDHACGEWRRRNLPWWEMPSAHCELCGRPLAGRVWAAAVEEIERSFCGPDCAALFRDRGAADGVSIAG
jgi:ribosome-binding protein aMBF1 (putative translation factor)